MCEDEYKWKMMETRVKEYFKGFHEPKRRLLTCGDRVNIINHNLSLCNIVCGIRLLAHIAHCYGWYSVMKSCFAFCRH